MHVLILGIGDAFTRQHFGSSALIAAPHGFVMIDCPDLIHRVLYEATSKATWKADAASIDDILLTHLHGDHCNGLESFGFHRRIIRLRNANAVRPRLHVSQVVAGRLWERLSPAMHAPMGNARPSTLEDYFDVRILNPDQPSQIGGLTVRCRPTQHPIPTLGFLISDGRSTLGWSGDTPFEQAHVDWLNHADLIVHESNSGPAHTPIQSLNGLPFEIKEKIHLIHLPDDLPAGATDLRTLHEGQTLDF